MALSSTIPDKVYKFVHKEDVFIKTDLIGRSSDHEWMKIDDQGTITVKGGKDDGYAWDGCSPKWNFIDLIIGTPDGRFDFATDKQITYYASMIHDALYQYKDDIKLSRKEVDILFKLNLKRSAFKLSGIYYFFVRCLGGCYGKWATKKSMNGIRITEFSWLKVKNLK